MSQFFIKRPIFAWALAVLLSLAGLISLQSIPVEQYPKVAPPSIVIQSVLPGASAEIIENSVTSVIEKSLSGIDNLRYFSSSSSSSGAFRIQLTFEQGTNIDTAQMQVQNKLQSALPFLPQAIKDQGINVAKSNTFSLMFIAIRKTNPNFNEDEMSDLLATTVKDRLSRVKGIGEVVSYASEMAMRIWLNPNKLYNLKLSAGEVASAIQKQNIDVIAGSLGGLPTIQGNVLNASIKSRSKLSKVEEFENIIIRTNPDGSTILLKDVAKVAIQARDYNTQFLYNGIKSFGMGILPSNGANALAIAKGVKEAISELNKTLPDGVEVFVSYDTTPFIEKSINGVVKTLIEAFVLVFIVILLFMQNFRASFVPTIAIPIVVLGTFAVLHLFGFTINSFTMFALVLAIGLLVDDAIVVVENVERIMAEEGLSPLDATIKSMSQIQGALVGIAVVLSAVFVPMAFFGGSAGVIYRQFSITIGVAMTFSVLVSLILSPALCATFLKPHKGEGLSSLKFFVWFNEKVANSSHFYANISGFIAGKKFRFIAFYLLIVLIAIFTFKRMPLSFVPTEDNGFIAVIGNLPSNSSLERTVEVTEKIRKYFETAEGKNVKGIVTFSGIGFSGISQNSFMAFITLKDWSMRNPKTDSAQKITQRAFPAMLGIKEAFVIPILMPPILELGNASGFEMKLLDEGNLGHDALMNARNQLLFMASQNPLLAGVRPSGLSDEPQYLLEINYKKANALGVEMAEIASMFGIAFASAYIGDFIHKNRMKRVVIQGDVNYRTTQEDIFKWFVKNRYGEMVSLRSFVKDQWTYGSPLLERFNGLPSISIQGAGAFGVSSGDAMDEIEKIARKLPEGITFAWSGLSFEEKMAGAKTLMLYTLSALIVFIALAALYESISIPFSIILIIPFGVLGSVLFSSLKGMANDVYFQIALLTTVGLSAKNAILIVEFARELYREGHSLLEANLIAIKQRFRPIIMTSLAFMFGVLPLAISSGAGAESQNAIGVAVLGGMVFSTFVSTFFVPLAYMLFEKKK